MLKVPPHRKANAFQSRELGFHDAVAETVFFSEGHPLAL